MPVQRIDTDWTRIFYRDLYASHADAHESGERKETVMKSPHSRDPDRPLGGSPLGAALVLLGIYIAMYLAVAGIVRIATPSEAVAAVRQDAPAVAAAPSPLSDPLARHGGSHAQEH